MTTRTSSSDRSGNQKRRRIQSVDAKVKRALQKYAEVKYYDTTATIATVTGTGTMVDLTNGMIQGVTSNDYVGDDFRLKSIQLRYVATSSVTTVNAGEMVRCIVFIDSDDGITSYSTLLEGAPYSLSGVNMANSKRIFVLADELLPISQSGTDGTAYTSISAVSNIYRAVSRNVEMSNKNIPKILFVSHNAKVQLTYYARIKFTDM